VVVTGGDADAAKTRSLHDRGGCDAAIALKPGADQFLIGVIRRSVGPTIHSGFSFAMPQTGDLILAGDSGLRMRANYSWSKGASPPDQRPASRASATERDVALAKSQPGFSGNVWTVDQPVSGDRWAVT